MANLFTLRIDTQPLARGIASLQARGPVACSRALNRSIASARTVMTREMSADLKLKQAVVRDELKISEASPGRLVAQLRVTGKRIPLIQFGAKGPRPSRGRGRGVTANLGGGRNRYPRAFIATMRSGHEGVFERVAKARLPIHELHGPSLPHVFRKYQPVGLARGQEALMTNLAHEFQFAMRGLPA